MLWTLTVKPVLQTRFGPPPEGNCYAACLASLLEIPLDRVPDDLTGPDWLDRANAFLVQYRLRAMTFAWDTERPWPFGPVWHVVSGRSPRGNWQHACVGFGGFVDHDPHPEGGGLVGTEREIDIFVTIDPTPVKPRVNVDLDDLLSLIACADDYGYGNPVLMDAFRSWSTPITDEEIEAYAASFLTDEQRARGYGEEDADEARTRLRDFRARFK